MTPIVICSTSGRCLPVLAASIKAYCANPVIWSGNNSPLADFGREATLIPNKGRSFGESYNDAVDFAFAHGADGVYISNDDVVLTPATMQAFEQDLESVREIKVGALAARSDWVMWPQNIRSSVEGDVLEGVGWKSESFIRETDVVAPIFCHVTREAWLAAKFPPINWYSDNIWCRDLKAQGFRNFVSRAYVHHAGSQSIGRDYKRLHDEALEWIVKNRPELVNKV